MARVIASPFVSVHVNGTTSGLRVRTVIVRLWHCGRRSRSKLATEPPRKAAKTYRPFAETVTPPGPPRIPGTCTQGAPGERAAMQPRRPLGELSRRPIEGEEREAEARVEDDVFPVRSEGGIAASCALDLVAAVGRTGCADLVEAVGLR